MVTEILENRAIEPQVDNAKRRQILDGARRVFLAHGFDGASMGEIARAAGVSKGTLYVYFDSKETLFEALTLAERGSLAEALFRLDEHDPNVRAVLRQLGHSFLEAMVRPDHISSVRMVIGAADKFPRFGRAFYESGPECGQRRLAAYLERQVEAGRLAIDDTSTAARHFLDLCSSGVLKRLLFGVGDAPPGADAIARNVEAALRVFFAAYGSQAAGSDQPPSRKAATTRA
jgi:AcrR family transcriptional regulator